MGCAAQPEGRRGSVLLYVTEPTEGCNKADRLQIALSKKIKSVLGGEMRGGHWGMRGSVIKYVTE